MCKCRKTRSTLSILQKQTTTATSCNGLLLFVYEKMRGIEILFIQYAAPWSYVNGMNSRSLKLIMSSVFKDRPNKGKCFAFYDYRNRKTFHLISMDISGTRVCGLTKVI